jgi:hypothetical protein
MTEHEPPLIRTLRESAVRPDDGEATRLRIHASLQRRSSSRRQVVVWSLAAAALLSSTALAFYVVRPAEPSARENRGDDSRIDAAGSEIGARAAAPETSSAVRADASAATPIAATGTADRPEGHENLSLQEEGPAPAIESQPPVRRLNRVRDAANRPLPARTKAAAPSRMSSTPVESPSPVVPSAPFAADTASRGQVDAPAVAHEHDANGLEQASRTKSARDLFMEAHRLHFRGSPERALAAWDAYLAVESTGSLAIEARYNRGVVLFRLGRMEEAREALTPFAQGAYGDFRRADARHLLSQLPP